MDPASLTTTEVRINGDVVGSLYIKPTLDRTPAWLSLFEGALGQVVNVHNASSAAIWTVQAGERAYALSFGYGKSLLRPGTWEEDFGLRVTLNAVDPSRIRSIDRVKFDAISQHSQIQASREANIIEFGLDVEQDILRAVTGKPRDAALATQLTGKDALKADVRLLLSDIPSYLVRLGEIFVQNTYKEHFSWVDQVSEVRDPSKIQRLDQELIAKITAGNFDRLWLAIPDRVEWEGVAGFKYRDSHKAPVHSDVYFPTFLQDEGENFVPSIDTLKKHRRIYSVSHENDLMISSWTVYRCIYCEIESEAETFLLNNGKWYRVRSDFLNMVDHSFEEVTNHELHLPDFSHDSEEDYNESVATQLPDTFCLMDRRLIHLVGRDAIEFCDLYSSAKLIIHVKRYRGSATLSHLFSQGVVSGELFCTIPEFREGVNNQLSEGFRFANTLQRPRNEEFEVVFGIVSKSRNPLKLPFFSRVNLRNAVQRLRAFGYKVSVVKVQDIAANRRPREVN
jgi:uncharacterized protein (TIGR04141 family)